MVSDNENSTALKQVKINLCLKKANELWENDKFEEAKDKYLEYFELGGEEDALVYSSLAHSYDNLGDKDNALEYYNKAIEMDPDNLFVRLNRGALFYEKEEYEKVIEDLSVAIENVDEADVYKVRGEAYYFLKQYQEAKDDFLKYLSLGGDKDDDIDKAIEVCKIRTGETSAATNARDSFKEAVEFYDKDNYEEAKKKFLEYFNAGGEENLDACFKCAYSCYETNDNDTALEYYNKVLKIDPNYRYARNNRGTIFDKKKEYEKAIEDYNVAIEIKNDNPMYYKNRGKTYYSMEKYEEAKQDFLKYFEFNGKDDEEIYFKLAYTYDKSGDDDKALEYYNKTLEIDPNYRYARNNRGLIYKSREEYEKAIEDYNVAIEVKNDNPLYYDNRGSAYYSMGNYEEAKKDFLKYFELNGKDDESIYFKLAYAYYKTDDDDNALEYCNKTLEIDPNYRFARDTRGKIYIDRGEYEKAIEDYNIAIEIKNDNPTYYENRGKAYYSMENYEEAKNDFLKYFELNGAADGEIYFKLAYTYDETGDDDKALEYYSKAIEINPDDHCSRNNRGLIYRQKDEYEKAIEDYSAAIEAESNDSLYYRNRGHAYYETGKYKEAEQDYIKYYDLGGEKTEYVDERLEECKTHNNDPANFKNSDIYIEKCGYAEIMSIEGFDDNLANKFLQLRKEGKVWYDIEKFANDFNLPPHFLVSNDAKRLKFPLKPAPQIKGRTLDF